MGRWRFEGPENLISHATEYYKTLFGPAPGNQFHMNLDIWNGDEKLNDEDNDDLTREFSKDEVKGTLFAMETNRAPGPDNIPAEFYQHCWGIIKK